jgi:hypothetical protein
MSEGERGPGPDIGDAAWAQNRWPAIGLGAGAGIALVLGVVFWAGWIKTLICIVAFALAGCLIGVVAAKIVYGDVDEQPGGDDRSA